MRLLVVPAGRCASATLLPSHIGTACPPGCRLRGADEGGVGCPRLSSSCRADRCAAGRGRRRARSSPAAEPPAAPALDEEALRRLVEQAVSTGRPPTATAGTRRRSRISVGSPCSVTRRPRPRRPRTRSAAPPPRRPTNCRPGPGGMPTRSGPTPWRRPSGPSRRPGPRPPSCAPDSSPSGTGSPSRRPPRSPRTARSCRRRSSGCGPAAQALADEQQALVADRRRIGSEQGELTATKKSLQASDRRRWPPRRPSWPAGPQRTRRAGTANWPRPPPLNRPNWCGSPG